MQGSPPGAQKRGSVATHFQAGPQFVVVGVVIIIIVAFVAFVAHCCSSDRRMDKPGETWIFLALVAAAPGCPRMARRPVRRVGS